ncbi:MAG: transferase [Desulfovibrionaceae bacterium]|nr:transferase [Desulfovibrionaceae bacterium]
MSINLTIVGNSGFARECHTIVQALVALGHDIFFRGFLSFEGYQADLGRLSPLFLGTDDAYVFGREERVIIGIGDPSLRHKAYAKLKKRGVLFYNLIHPDVYVDESAQLGEANILTSGCYVSCDCRLGNANVLNGVVHLGHDAVLGHCNFVGPGVQIEGFVTVGDCNSIGTMSVLLPHCKIGSHNKIAPLSAVYKGCGDKAYMLGNPALKVGKVSTNIF